MPESGLAKTFDFFLQRINSYLITAVVVDKSDLYDFDSQPYLCVDYLYFSFLLNNNFVKVKK